MSMLNSKFDVIRGYPNEGALDQPFEPDDSSGSVETIPGGYIVEVKSSNGKVTKSTKAASTIKEVFVVFEGNDDFSAQFADRLNCLRGFMSIVTDIFNAGTYALQQEVTFSAGKLAEASSGDQVIGRVVENNVATNGTITVDLNLPGYLKA